MACLSSSALLVFFKYNPIGPRSHRSCALDFPNVKSAPTWLSSSIPHLWLCCAFPSTFSIFSWLLSCLTFYPSNILLISAFWDGPHHAQSMFFPSSFPFEISFIPNLSASNSEISIYSQIVFLKHTHTRALVPNNHMSSQLCFSWYPKNISRIQAYLFLFLFT